MDVNYNFRINLADYKRVIGVADTNVSGRFTLAGSHVLTFDRAALPRRKVMSWYKAPSKPDTEYACGSDDSTFPLRELHRMRVDVAVAERGYAYYAENRVRYLCLDGMKGYALVEGTEPYDVEFVYSDGMIYALTCSCYCVGNCKHEVAAMLQLREMLDRIEENYAGEYAATGYFAAVAKDVLLSLAVNDKTTCTLTLEPRAADEPDFDAEFDGGDEERDDSDW